MSLDEKLERLNKLKKIEYPSLKETAEIESLEEEIKLELEDSNIIEPEHKQEPVTSEPVKPEQKKKMTIYEKYIKPKLKGKPMTWDEVQQLKLEAMGTRLKRHISEDKAKIRQAKSDRFNAIFSMVTGRGTESKPTKKSKKGKSKKDDDDLRSLLGADNPSKYRKLLDK